ncbi:MAG: YbhB/YbcL family Raf kinase inhibitor-like protein [Peptococcaceae bacterium]|jgi:Raf kinase inhibitor-like YbhB/YbcL family protein|nr:YbhB/YbcL family Raf kinase inhibitor-like protein [Peptococcaceae bacterium]
MYITSSGLDERGHWKDIYGKRGTQFGKDAMPTYSIPLEIHDAPVGTKSYVIVFDDMDAVPVCGFVWLHWLVANLTHTSLAENESITATGFIQGVNSRYSHGNMTREEAAVYGGMAPPDQPHIYDLKVYALDTLLPLKNGFFYNELCRAMQGHILAEAVLSGIYEA